MTSVWLRQEITRARISSAELNCFSSLLVDNTGPFCPSVVHLHTGLQRGYEKFGKYASSYLIFTQHKNARCVKCYLQSDDMSKDGQYYVPF